MLVVSQDTGGVLTYLEHAVGSRARDDKVSVLVRGIGKDSRTLVAKSLRALGGRSRELPTCEYVLVIFDKDSDVYVEGIVRDLWNNVSAETFISAPCFEYFFCLHFNQNRPAANRYSELLPILRQLKSFEGYSKDTDAVPVALLMSKRAKAITNAANSRSQCRQEASAGPYTELDLLLEAVEVAKTQGIEALRQTMSSRNERRFQAK